MLWLLLAACTDKGGYLDTSSPDDTGNPECGRLRGATGVLMYTEDGASVHAPTEAPDPEKRTTGIAGPLTDGLTWLAVEEGRVYRSDDAGCNWDDVGTLPVGVAWQLLAAGDRVYAFDLASGDGARSDDRGLSWSPFDAGGAFLDLPVASHTDGTFLRGVQARGVVSSYDGGDTWTVTGALPDGTPRRAAVSAATPDRVVVSTDLGVWTSPTGGGSWQDVTAGLTTDATVPGVAGGPVAVHPDDEQVLFAISEDGGGVWTLHRSADYGATWTRMADSDQVTLDGASPLWPLPGAPTRVLSAYGSSVDDFGLDLYLSEQGVGTRTLHISSYYGMTGMSFGADRWIASVHGVP